MSAIVSVGDELPRQRIALSENKFVKWYVNRPADYTGPKRSVHSHPDVAKAEGLPGEVAAAADIAILIFRSMRELCGEGWDRGGRSSLRIRRPSVASDFLISRGVVTALAPEGDAVRVLCDVWVENQHGDKKVVGTASGLIPPALADTERS